MSWGEGWILDEFTICQEWEAAVREERRLIEKLFGVELNILGVLGQVQGPRNIQEAQQIWLQLKGPRDNLNKAKDYIKGLCNPEMTEQLSYPKDMHCIFLGATGLFLNCLISGTSANISVAHGSLQISGLTESVVMAHSRIQEFVERYQKNHKLPEEQEARVKKTFKALVEAYADKHTMDLLILPISVKEELLSLVEEVAFHQNILNISQKDQNPNTRLLGPPESWKEPEILEVCPRDLVRSQEADQRKQLLQKRASRPIPDFSNSTRDELPGSSEPRNHHKRTGTSGEPGTAQMSQGQIYLFNENDLQTSGVSSAQGDMLGQDTQLQKFLGLPKSVPQSNGEEEEEPGDSVLMSSGTEKEFCMLLNFFKTMGYEEGMVKKVLVEEGVQEPSEILDRLQVEQKPQRPGSPTLEGHSGERIEAAGVDNEYLLELLKSAVENCGYSPSEVTDLKEGSLATLLRKLNEGRAQGTEDPKMSERRHHGSPSKIVPCGPPIHRPWTALPEANGLVDTRTPTSGSSTPGIGQASTQEPVEDVCPAAVGTWVAAEGGRNSHTGQTAVSVVTGVQRFNEAIQTPFQLNLRNKPGKENLRHVIIDGSNVAMVHGLSQFFSCRGIALAVQYFWDRGHRELTVFVPQWRMKRDRKAKEQHFLTELNAVGLLSFTPSRTVEGKRITPYDDRFLLQLAEQTDGVILTNDNLKDMAEESGRWKEIIKERLLQFTFAGDIFLVPDDPLGRNGPDLDQFLSKTQKHRFRAEKSHTFAGQCNPVRVPPRPASQTEILTPWDQRTGGDMENGRAAEGRERPRLTHETDRLRKELLDIFTDQAVKVDFILQREPCTQDLNKLSELILNLKF